MRYFRKARTRSSESSSPGAVAFFPKKVKTEDYTRVMKHEQNGKKHAKQTVTRVHPKPKDLSPLEAPLIWKLEDDSNAPSDESFDKYANESVIRQIQFHCRPRVQDSVLVISRRAFFQSKVNAFLLSIDRSSIFSRYLPSRIALSIFSRSSLPS